MGHKFKFRATPVPNWNVVIEGEVLVVEPNEQLSYTWSSMSMSGGVAWTLTPTKTGTLVRMEQSGFREDQEANCEGAKYGWQKSISNLDKVVAGLKWNIDSTSIKGKLAEDDPA